MHWALASAQNLPQIPTDFVSQILMMRANYFETLLRQRLRAGKQGKDNHSFRHDAFSRGLFAVSMKEETRAAYRRLSHLLLSIRAIAESHWSTAAPSV